MILSCCEGEVDLGSRWKHLIASGRVQTICTLQHQGKEISVRYGLEITNSRDITAFSVNHHSNEPLEFIEYSKSGEEIKLQEDIPLKLRSLLNYRFFYTSTDISIVSIPNGTPQKLKKIDHKEDNCSFCTGAFTLLKREPLATISCKISHRKWQFHWNIAPQDYNGHFLLVPDLDNKNNRRPQFIQLEDIEDILDMMGNVKWNKEGGIIGYNSIGAGASQNHIHCHVFASPSPLLNFFEENYSNPVFVDHENQIKLFIRTKYHGTECSCCCIEIKYDACTSSSVIFRFIKVIVQLGLPFNLIFGSKAMLIFVRK